MGSLSDDATWAVTEFAEAELGDLRRTQRVVELATVLAQRPGASLPEACGDRATLKAAYRFFDNRRSTPRTSWIAMSTRRSPAWPPSRWCWPCKIPPSWTGPPTRPPRAWGRWDTRPIAACTCTPRWRSRPSACPWACWPNRCGPATPTTWASAPPAAAPDCREGKPEVADEP